MNLDEILEEWRIDSPINQLNLIDAAANVPALHHKYLKMLSTEKLSLYRLQAKMRMLKLDKYEHYTQGASKESLEKGWKLPPKGVVMKTTEAPMYLDADKEINDLQLLIHYHEEKIGALTDIVKSIHNRGYLITNIIQWTRFQNGL